MGILTAGVLLLAPSITFASDPLTAAATAEAAGKWEQAAGHYLRAVQLGRGTPDVRAKAEACLRRAAQAQRLRDPAFGQFVASLEPADALNLYAEVLGTLATTYPDADRCRPPALFRAGLDELERALADPAFRAAHLSKDADLPWFRAVMADARETAPPTVKGCRQAALDLLPKAARRLGLNGSVLVFELLCGACGGLDGYTVYVAPDAGRAERAVAAVELAGYGLRVSFPNDAAVIEAVEPNSFAAIHTPLRAGDRLVKANGRPLLPASAVALADCLRTPAMGGHDLEAVSTAGEPVRAFLPTPAPTVLQADRRANGVGYLRLAAVRDGTPDELDQALVSLSKKGPVRAAVLDLRDNPGGNFLAGVRAAERFVPGGILAQTSGRHPSFANRVFSSASGAGAWDVPLVLLVDGRTMSAAEVFAAAVKGHNRAFVVGTPTFGKGLIQCPFELSATSPRPAGKLVVTVARASGPTGEPIHGVGVIPHLIVPEPEKQMEAALARAAELSMR